MVRKKSQEEKARELIKFSGRQEWGRNPTTRVAPNKKKPEPLRKTKHKGRRDADLWRFWGLQQHYFFLGNHAHKVDSSAPTCRYGIK